MAVSRDEVLHVAQLARLRLSDAEVARFTHQLNDILSHVEALAQAEETPASDTPDAGVAPETAPLRADEPGADALDRPPEALAAAWVDGFFILPRLPALEVAEPVDEAEPAP